jgi:DNA-binding winged helix-turn-helix (wHTH) protein
MSFSPSSNETNRRRLLYFATFVIDLDSRDLRCNGERVRLTAKPFDTLALLIEKRGQVVTREQLRATVWDGVNVSDPAIEHAVNKARKALGDDTANPQFIYTFGLGLRLRGRRRGLAEAVADCTRKELMESLTHVPLLIIDDFGMRKLPLTAAEDLLEIIMRRSNAPARCSLPTVLWRTGANCWATSRPSPPCSTASSITVTYSSGVRRSWRTKTAAATGRDNP